MQNIWSCLKNNDNLIIVNANQRKSEVLIPPYPVLRNQENQSIKFLIMQKYKTLKTLGDGAFGSVYKAENTKTGEIVAIKKMKGKFQTWNECIQLREIKSLRKMNHPNVIKLKEVLLVADQLYMVFEYLDYNIYEVYSKMKDQGKFFTEPEIKSMVFQILNGLAHMHKNGFFHRDMKPENLLIYNNLAKVCDLGLARQIRSRPPFTDYVSTRWYRAPELLLRSTNYNSPVDIFALGAIMAELYTFAPLFPGANETDQLNKIVKILGTPDKNDWPEGYKLAQNLGYYFPQEKAANLGELIPNASIEALDIIESMLKYSSRKRPTAIELLKHQYFKGVKLPEDQVTNKNDKVIFEQKPDGKKLDTSKQDKKMDVFRATKEKFKQTRKQDAMESNPFKNLQKNNSFLNKSPQKAELDDLDSLIKELQNKSSQKKQEKLPLIQSKDKLNYKPIVNPIILRQSKTQVRHNEPFRGGEREDWKTTRDEQKKKQENTLLKKQPVLKTYADGMSRKGVQSKKFGYSFQPAALPNFNPVFNPALLAKGKSVSNLGLSKPRSPMNPVYKY